MTQAEPTNDMPSAVYSPVSVVALTFYPYHQASHSCLQADC